MKTKEELKKIRNKNLPELVKELQVEREKYFQMRKDHLMEKLKKTADLKKVKKNIARCQTVIREKIAADLIKDSSSKEETADKKIKNNQSQKIDNHKDQNEN